jgi:UDP-N-acetylmuramate dehydrogenase
VESVDYLDGNGQIHRGVACRFSYRQSSLPPDAIVLRVIWKVTPGVGAPADIQKKMEQMAQRRRARQPREPSGGSVFRNPDGASAGQLIQECGLCGVSRGGAQISPIHGNVIVNTGGATARDVLALLYLAKHAVHRRFAVDLKPEIRYLSNHGGDILE